MYNDLQNNDLQKDVEEKEAVKKDTKEQDAENTGLQHMCMRSSILVQLLALPLPLLCTGQAAYENVKEVGNSHDLIAAILGRVLLPSTTQPTEQKTNTLKDAFVHMELVHGSHAGKLLDALQFVKDDSLLMPSGYEPLCAYTRTVIEKLVALDSGNVGQLDIRIMHDVGCISRSQHSSLVINAKDFCKSMLILLGADEDAEACYRLQKCKDYKDFVEFNLWTLWKFLCK
jgi:hypothetical protein